MTSSPWEYFVWLFWRGVVYAIMTYIFVWGLTHFKQFCDWK